MAAKLSARGRAGLSILIFKTPELLCAYYFAPVLISAPMIYTFVAGELKKEELEIFALKAEIWGPLPSKG